MVLRCDARIAGWRLYIGIQCEPRFTYCKALICPNSSTIAGRKIGASWDPTAIVGLILSNTYRWGARGSGLDTGQQAVGTYHAIRPTPPTDEWPLKARLLEMVYEEFSPGFQQLVRQRLYLQTRWRKG